MKTVSSDAGYSRLSACFRSLSCSSHVQAVQVPHQEHRISRPVLFTSFRSSPPPALPLLSPRAPTVPFGSPRQVLIASDASLLPDTSASSRFPRPTVAPVGLPLALMVP